MSNNDVDKTPLTSGQKKRNTVFFIIVGTLLNVVLCLFLLFVFIGLVSKFLPNQIAIIMPFIFIVAVILAMVIYQKLINWIIIKWNLEEKLEPLFLSKRKNHKKK
ncbi:MAG: hypothetical protein BKP49_06410 [Treponema sp. CETP13]|nr:MAG: hypothetical protein BKP49_06410 [Treponema sp. CETP13]